MRSIKVLVTLAAFLGIAPLAAAQDFPTKTVRLIAPASEGFRVDELQVQ